MKLVAHPTAANGRDALRCLMVCAALNIEIEFVRDKGELFFGLFDGLFDELFDELFDLDGSFDPSGFFR